MRAARTIGLLSLVLLVHGAASANPVAYLTHAATGRASVLDVVTGAMVADIPVGQGPEMLAVSPDGERVYVLNRCGLRPTTTGYCDDFGEPGTPGTVSVIDTATNHVVETIDTVRYANTLTIAPDGTRLYVTTPCSPGNVLPCGRGFRVDHRYGVGRRDGQDRDRWLSVRACGHEGGRGVHRAARGRPASHLRPRGGRSR